MSNQIHSAPKKAYTLVELIVVAAVILFGFAILMNIGSGDGARLSSAQRTLSGLVKAARSQAILKNAQTRLIIHNDSAEVDKYQRFIGIIYDENPDPNIVSWVAAGKGTYLPKGIYFDAATSNIISGAAWSEPTMQIDYPRLSGQDGSSGTDHLYYEFEDNGTSLNSNAYLVFRAGRFIPGSDDPDFPTEKANLKSALIFRPNGTATLVDDPGDI